ncbi:MAG: Fe-S cluster assembly ATPase SufC [Actinobacteria bacterium QS_8_72_14]|nr:MAG: Fe-S cluster assembly ATPase SufC [Actinobacteria bacterium QS_8_72_14]
MAELEIKGLVTEVEGAQILKGVDLTIRSGETHALMGPNGSGKSTLAYAIMGHPSYEITGGSVTLDGQDVLAMAPEQRAAQGLFLAMQYPTEIPGVSLTNFLRTALNQVRGEETPVRQFMSELREHMTDLGMDEKFMQRNVNEGFSGGEKKRFEILQLALLTPRTLIITHYSRILQYVTPDYVHVLVDGRVAKSGGPELADELESTGYEQFREAPV